MAARGPRPSPALMWPARCHDAPGCRRQVGNPPISGQCAAVSVGIVKGEPLLDLCYEEDSAADVDMNIVMREDGRLIEVQGSAEREAFSRDLMDALIDLGQGGIRTLFDLQTRALHDPRRLVIATGNRHKLERFAPFSTGFTGLSRAWEITPAWKLRMRMASRCGQRPAQSPLLLPAPGSALCGGRFRHFGGCARRRSRRAVGALRGPRL